VRVAPDKADKSGKEVICKVLFLISLAPDAAVIPYSFYGLHENTKPPGV